MRIVPICQGYDAAGKGLARVWQGYGIKMKQAKSLISLNFLPAGKGGKGLNTFFDFFEKKKKRIGGSECD